MPWEKEEKGNILRMDRVSKATEFRRGQFPQEDAYAGNWGEMAREETEPHERPLFPSWGACAFYSPSEE